MKKKKRELTLEQLERKEKFEKKIPLIIILLSFCVFLALIITIIIADIYFKNDANVNKICSVYICIELFLAALMIISYKVWEKTKNQIILKQKQMKLKVLKQLAKEHEGCIKDFVSLKDEKVITDILSKNIVRITIDFIQDKNFVTTIQYADGTFRSGIRILAKEFVSILDENSKNVMLNDLVKDIRLENSIGDTKEIVIAGQAYVYKKDISDNELPEMFELKE